MKFSKLIPIVFLFMVSCSAPVASVPMPTLMPEPTATQTLIPTSTEIPTQTPVPERFTKENLSFIPESSAEIANCVPIAPPSDVENWEKDIDAIYAGAGGEILKNWNGAVINVGGGAMGAGTNMETATFYIGTRVEPAISVRFIDTTADGNKRNVVMLGLVTERAGNRFFWWMVPDPDNEGRIDSDKYISTVDNILKKLPIDVNKGFIFSSSLSKDNNDTVFTTKYLGLKSQLGTSQDLFECVVAKTPKAGWEYCSKLRYKIFTVINAQ